MEYNYLRNKDIEDLKDEVWIKNNGYQISNKGRIIGKRGGLLKCRESWCGYIQCDIEFEDGFRAKSVHRAVAHLFIPNDDPEHKIQVNHIDGNKKNNCVENLEWCTREENQQHEVRVLQQRNGDKHYHNVVTKEQAIEIYNLCKDSDLLYKEIAEMYDVFPQEVSRIATMRKWKCLGLEPIVLVRGSRGKTRQKPVRVK